MNDRGLLVSLRTYRSREERDSLEDFVTEARAWLLRREPDLAEAALERVLRGLGSGSEEERTDGSRSGNRWSTQVAGGDVRFDLVAEFGDGAVVFEHKVWSRLGLDQLSRYVDAAARHYGRRTPVVLVTPSPFEAGDVADLHIRWLAVRGWCETWFENKTALGRACPRLPEFARTRGARSRGFCLNRAPRSRDGGW